MNIAGFDLPLPLPVPLPHKSLLGIGSLSADGLTVNDDPAYRLAALR